MESAAPMSNTAKALLAVLLASASLLYLAGIRGDLPYEPYVDEAFFVDPAVHIAATGDLNPHWFGNPGSTVIYPLAAMYHAWNSVRYGEPAFQANPGLADRFDARPSPFYLLGRLLNVAYALLTVAVLFAFARSTFNVRIALVAVALFVFNPLTIAFVHLVRTDIAATFWGLLSLALLVRLQRKPSLANQVLAGAAIGLSIGTRYFMGILGLLLLFVDLLQVVADRERIRRLSSWLEMGAGGAAVLLVFTVSTPYFFLDLATALEDIVFEARSTHLGADGLSPLGNLAFYLTDAVSRSVSVPQALLALAGAVLVFSKRRTTLYLLPVFVLTFLVGVSVQRLHWDRWIIPVFPALAILAAYSLGEISRWSGERWRARGRNVRFALPAVMAIAAIGLPLVQSAAYTYKVIHPSTRLLAREWVLENLPDGSRIVAEVYTAPKLKAAHDVLEPGIAFTDEGVDAYSEQGYEYILVSSSIYGRFYGEPERYRSEIQFYEDLFTNYRLLHEVGPDVSTAGPTIRVYALDRSRP